MNFKNKLQILLGVIMMICGSSHIIFAEMIELTSEQMQVITAQQGVYIKIDKQNIDKFLKPTLFEANQDEQGEGEGLNKLFDVLCQVKRLMKVDPDYFFEIKAFFNEDGSINISQIDFKTAEIGIDINSFVGGGFDFGELKICDVDFHLTGDILIYYRQ